MNYIKTTTANLLKAIDLQKSGYKTPKAVIEKLTKYDYLYINPPWQSKKRKQ